MRVIYSGHLALGRAHSSEPNITTRTDTDGEALMTKQITPRYKVMLFYDLIEEDAGRYYEFVMNEMLPEAQAMGLYFFRLYHTLWGSSSCPLRQAEFVAEDLETVQSALDSPAWEHLEVTLQQFVTNYNRKVVTFRTGFQL